MDEQDKDGEQVMNLLGLRISNQMMHAYINKMYIQEWLACGNKCRMLQ